MEVLKYIAVHVRVDIGGRKIQTNYLHRKNTGNMRWTRRISSKSLLL